MANKRLVRTSGTRRNFGIIARYTRAVALQAVYSRSGRPQCRTTEAFGGFLSNIGKKMLTCENEIIAIRHSESEHVRLYP